VIIHPSLRAMSEATQLIDIFWVKFIRFYFYFMQEVNRRIVI